MTDYGIVLLSEFARRPPATSLNARDLSAQTHVPLPTVSKILKMLTRGEILVSQRGQSGGYRLAKSPREISVADIIRQFEGPMRLTECSHPGEWVCGLEVSCPVRSHWQKINHVVDSALKGLTLFDMAQPFAKGGVVANLAVPLNPPAGEVRQA